MKSTPIDTTVDFLLSFTERYQMSQVNEASGNAERKLLAVPLRTFQTVLFLGIFGKIARKFHDNIKTLRKICLLPYTEIGKEKNT